MQAHEFPNYLTAADLGAWGDFVDQIDRAAPYLEEFVYLVETLKRPKRALIVDVPIRMDDGKLRHFEGYRVQHNTARGPGKGGVRFHQDVTLAEVMALAGWMSVKNAAVGLPYGGAKGGVRVDPSTLSLTELERLTRRYTSEINILIGPDKDIPAPDVNTNEQVMAWMMDTYSMNEGRTSTGVVTGKPVSLGGSLGRRGATGRGVYVVSRAAAEKLQLLIPGAKVCIQGYGNVGHSTARYFAEAGALVVAIQDVTGTIVNARGVDVPALNTHVLGGGRLVDWRGGDAIPSEQFWDIESDFLVPAALERQITAANAGRIRTRMIVEGANGPTTPAADDILASRGIPVIPDVLANAGGVIVSYFEWVQDFSSFFWSEQDISQRLDALLKEAFAAIWTLSESKRVSMRTAAFIVGCKKILQARHMRGLYP